MHQGVIETNLTHTVRKSPCFQNSASRTVNSPVCVCVRVYVCVCVCVSQCHAGQRMKMDLIVCYCDLIEWFVAQLSTGGALGE